MPTHQFYSKSAITNDPVKMGGVINWRKKLSNFWPVQIRPSPIIINGQNIFEEQYTFSSVEQAFHWAKYHFTDQLPSYPSILTQYVPSEFIDDARFLKEIRPIMVNVKSSSGKKNMKKLGHTLLVDKWDNARVQVTAHLLRTRLKVDYEFRSILQNSEGDLLHFERTGAKSFWGGAIKHGGNNALGVLMMQLREELKNTPRKRAPRRTPRKRDTPRKRALVDVTHRQRMYMAMGGFTTAIIHK